MKITAIAPSNIAFIKYWGKKDDALRLPTNGSISMNLSNLLTTTTVEFSSDYDDDIVIIEDNRHSERGSRGTHRLVHPRVEESHTSQSSVNEIPPRTMLGRDDIGKKRVIEHLNRIRKLAGIFHHAKVVSKNNFPSSTGLSSSASGFAALTVAASHAAGLHLSEKELSILARLGSGSACRSIPSGFVEWVDGDTSETSYAQSLYPPEYWNITDVVVIFNNEKKSISTTEGQKRAVMNPFFQTRLMRINAKIRQMKDILKKKDFTALGELTEGEALELVAMHMTSKPSIILLKPQTVQLMQIVRNWRHEGLEVYFSLNTGQNVHIIVQKKDSDVLMKKLDSLEGIQEKIMNIPTQGIQLMNYYLI